MILTISTNYQPAPDLGYLLPENTANFQSFDLPFGKARFFYPREWRSTTMAEPSLAPVPARPTRVGSTMVRVAASRVGVARPTSRACGGTPVCP